MSVLTKLMIDLQIFFISNSEHILGKIIMQRFYTVNSKHTPLATSLFSFAAFENIGNEKAKWLRRLAKSIETFS